MPRNLGFWDPAHSTIIRQHLKVLRRSEEIRCIRHGMAVSGNFCITDLDAPLTGGFRHSLTSIAAEGGREGGQGSTQKPGFLGYCDTVPGILCTVLLLGCMHAHSSSSSSSLQWKKLTAPEGVPGRSPTPVLTRPCAA